MSANLPKRFLSRREKNGHRRGKSSEGPQKHRPISSEAFFALFKPGGTKHHAEEENEKEEQVEVEPAKIAEVRQKLADDNIEISTLRDDHIQYALNLRSCYMDVDKAIEMILLQQTSLAGNIVRYNPAVHMLGAENRENVTCYLDALLFAMFAKIESFECMLRQDNLEEPRRKLAVLLRLWVNMLRSGKLIETDMTHHLQDALADCGWAEAKLIEQQDTSEAFAFITETLQLPLLPLQVDLFHHGENDEADHRVVYERLLNIAVPSETEGKDVRLEDCLEEYFNAQVDVLRDSTEEKAKVEHVDMSRPTDHTDNTLDIPKSPRSTIRIVEAEVGSESTSPLPMDNEQSMIQQRHWAPASNADQESGVSSPTSQPTKRPLRNRTDSIIQRVVIDDKKPSTIDDIDLFPRTEKTASVVKAVTIPAWQFFRLIPWHSSANEQPQSDLEVARHFNQRPVLGICLKRYTMDSNGEMKRQNTYIDIPETLGLPRFIVDDRVVEDGSLTSEYKLVLQSVVCHRGDSLHSGHYISFCRVAPKFLTDNRRHESDPPPDYEEAQWVKFDDLASERITTIDDIKQSLKEEMPYLLFYQIVPIVDVAASSSDDNEPEPPAYDDTGPQVITSDADHAALSSKASSYFDCAIIPSTAASIRFSNELERPPRRSFADEDGYLSVSRPDSTFFAESMATGSAVLSVDPSPAVTPAEETTAQKLSRAAAKLRANSKSRPGSQGAEGRISVTMSRLGFMKGSREPLRESAFDDPDLNSDEINGQSKEKLTLENGKGKEKETGHKRGKSKTRADKEKTKELDRECVVQ
ncbi:cysteine proteinase [Xylariaceae sp. FL1019]|nr:cysteine proteinase [Xylariaceae sp. FL1019]